MRWSVRTVQSSSQKDTSHDGLDQSALLALLSELKLTNVTDRIRMVTETLYQELIDAEATAHIGADRFERSDERTTQRNGTRPRVLTTTAGDLNLKIPKLRQGSFFPAWS